MRTTFNGFLTLLLALCFQAAFAQQTITGTVTDDTGLPLPGANVIIQGTSTGTQTDFDGNYTIMAEPGQTLEISFTGFATRTVAVTPTTTTVNVTLEMDVAELGEVVITGYTSRNQTTSTSAVVSISSEDITHLPTSTSIDNLLQGKAAGVQVTAANGKPGQGAFVRIRGVGSLSAGGSSPLYIVDGAPVREVDLASIPNEDIEDISILKDAATTAMYGSRGANGVVLITTKRGNRDREGQIKVSSRFGYIDMVPDNFTMMNATQKMQYEAELYALNVPGAGSRPGVTTTPDSPERQFLLDHEVDWKDRLLKTGFVQSNNVSFSGGAERMDYFFSLGHDRNTGIIDKLNGFERINARLNTSYDVKDWLTLRTNVGYSRSRSDEPRDRNNVQNPFRAMYVYNAYEPEFLLDEDGNVMVDENGNPLYNPTHQGFNVRNSLDTEPEFLLTNQTLASFDALFKFNQNWSYTFNTAANFINFRREYYYQPFGELDSIIGDPDFPGGKTDNGGRRADMTVSNRLNYALQTENGHDLNVLGLFEFNHNENTLYTLTSRGFPSASISTQSQAAEVTNGDTFRNILTLVSYGVFADYNFDQRYLFSASIRRDGSSSFGNDTKYGTFWSLSAGWNIARENFFNSEVVDNLKLRGSYGTVGNRFGISRYDSQNTVQFGQYPGGSSTIPANVANPLLAWETTYSANVGLEFSFFNSRLRGVTDVFQNDTKDLLFNVPTALESGIPGYAIRGNVGDIQNRGVEITLSGDLIRTSDIVWTLGGNVSFLDHKIVNLPEEEMDAPGTFNVFWREGDPINQHYLIRYAGVDPSNGAPLYYGADGETYRLNDLPEGENRVLDGRSTIPTYDGGFFTDLIYKGWGLRADFVFRGGNYVNNFMRSSIETDGGDINGNHHVGAFNYWKEPGDTDVLPSPIYWSEVIASDRFLEKADFVRLRNVILSYNFPSKMLERNPINSLRIYLQGTNLLTFTEFFGDPEVGISSGETISFGNTVAPGEATLFSYPRTRSIQLGVDISF